MRLLLVEDDKLMGAGIKTGLRQDGYNVDWFESGSEAGHAIEMENFDMMILDLGLPDKDGIEVLREVRSKKKNIPVLILTARNNVSDRVEGLDAGADDYMSKPFDLRELNARIRALVRRNKGRVLSQIQYGSLVIDPARREVKLGGQIIDLSPKEFAVLETLLENAGSVVTKTRLEESVYSWGHEVESNALEVHIHNLRRKLNQKLIRTVRGVGYLLKEAV